MCMTGAQQNLENEICAQRRLGSESSLGAQWIEQCLKLRQTDSKDSDHTERMRWLI